MQFIKKPVKHVWHWSKLKKLSALLAALVVFTTFITSIILAINYLVLQKARSHIYTDIAKVEPTQTALVLGAKVYQDGNLSGMTKDRALTAVELYQQKKVQKILISGDHGTKNYDEVNTIKNFLLEQGIPGKDIFLDHAGFDTYDSLYRAREIFQVSSVIVVTQRFHITRAVYIGQSLGIETTGISADKQDYGHTERVEFRERIARVKAFLDVVFDSRPKFLGETIPITGDSTASWD